MSVHLHLSPKHTQSSVYLDRCCVPTVTRCLALSHLCHVNVFDEGAGGMLVCLRHLCAV